MQKKHSRNIREKYGRPHFLKAIASGFDGAVGGRRKVRS